MFYVIVIFIVVRCIVKKQSQLYCPEVIFCINSKNNLYQELKHNSCVIGKTAVRGSC